MKDFLTRLGIREVNSGAFAGAWLETKGDELVSICPADEKPIARVRQATEEDYETVVRKAHETFLRWRMLPAPQRGEIVRQMAVALREKKQDLGSLVSYEMGKILSEGLGEVQEAIDIADYAVGLSRQLYGLSMHSERPSHRMYEQWHPLGVVGIVTAFNFPVAVWAWNAMIAAVCGDTMIWKPSSQTPLCAIATQNVVNEVLERNGFSGVMNLVIGRGSTVGERMVQDKRVPLVSATGSCRMGRRIGEAVAKRLGRTILELGGNNAILVDESADLDMALRAILFGAVGTAGQRCTTTRRIFVHEKVHAALVKKLVAAYESVPIGDPLDPKTLMGPLVNQGAVETMEKAIAAAVKEGGKVLAGGKRHGSTGFFVKPTIIEGRPEMKIVQEETFAPILYVFPYRDLEQAIAAHNGVDQGLSSAIFTRDLLNAETFLSHRGSDCGIANVNIGTSGAEIGGAFGGEKDTGGGREAGSDSWKAYMRRQTCTINWGKELPLAQGVKFEL
jgi:aldehyde dehydrogenase (NAD+)